MREIGENLRKSQDWETLFSTLESLKDFWFTRWRGFAWAFCALLAMFALSLSAEDLAKDWFRWDKKKNQVSARFKDWPIEKVLTQIALATDWDVQIPVDSGVVVSGTFEDLPPASALKRLFGHFNYAVFRSSKNGKPRLQVFLPGVETVSSALLLSEPEAVSTNQGTFFPSFPPSKRLRPEDILKRFDKDGDGKIGNEERKEVVKSLNSPASKQ